MKVRRSKTAAVERTATAWGEGLLFPSCVEIYEDTRANHAAREVLAALLDRVTYPSSTHPSYAENALRRRSEQPRRAHRRPT
jgi:hypothetical protein